MSIPNRFEDLCYKVGDSVGTWGFKKSPYVVWSFNSSPNTPEKLSYFPCGRQHVFIIADLDPFVNVSLKYLGDI